MSAAEAASTATKHDLEGSCHCGAIKFQVKQVDLSAVHNCSCSICVKSGRLDMMVKDGNFLVTQGDGSSESITYKNSRETGIPEWTTYSFTELKPGEHEVYHHFCNKCGVTVSVTGYLPAIMGALITVNLRCLDLGKVGKTLCELTEPAKVTYVDGGANTWASRKGEPWPTNAW